MKFLKWKEKSTHFFILIFRALDLIYQREMAEKQQLQKSMSRSKWTSYFRSVRQRSIIFRRSAFGSATYVMSNAKGIGENQLICHRPLENLNGMEFDREKKRMRRPKNRALVQNDPDEAGKHHSALGIRLFLREFCSSFLDNCYNILLPRARVKFISDFHCKLSYRFSSSLGNHR